MEDLGDVPGVLSVLDHVQLADLRTRSRVCHHGKGDEILRQGARSETVIVLLEGRVRVISGSVTGRELLLAIRGPGDLLGELAATDGHPHSASVLALDAGRTLVIPSAVFRELLLAAPRLSTSVLSMVGMRLRGSNMRLAEQVDEPIETRLCRRLLMIAARDSELVDGRLELTMPLTQAQLATWVGATRESTAKALAGLRRAGHVETGRGRFAILNLEAVRNMVP